MGQAPDRPGMDADRGGMESIHPRIRVAWIGRVLVFGLVVGAGLTGLARVLDADWPWVWALAVALALLGAGHAVLRYRVWGFALQEDALYLERGVITQVVTSVPFVRIQHVDTRRGPVDRSLGLARVVVYTAGSRGADVAIPGLRPARAEALRERLRDLAGASDFEDAT